jgi:hypothetical protein
MQMNMLPGEQLAAVPGFPPPSDLADVWLVHALVRLLDAYDIPDTDRPDLIASVRNASTVEIPVTSAASGEARRLERLDAARLALVSAALAVEARMNTVLRHGDPAEWEAVAHLVPAERFRVAPRLLDRRESASKHEELCDLVDEIFRVRDELVDAAGEPCSALNVMSSRFSPSHARAMVEASARICHFLATLAEEQVGGTAELVRDVARAFDLRLDHRPKFIEREPGWEWNWHLDQLDFPPDIVGS